MRGPPRPAEPSSPRRSQGQARGRNYPQIQTPERGEGKNNERHLLAMHSSAWEKLSPQIAESAAADKLVNRMTGPQLLAISIDKALCAPLCFPISCGLHARRGRRAWGRKWLALTSQTHGICIPKVAQQSFGFLFRHLCRLEPL